MMRVASVVASLSTAAYATTAQCVFGKGGTSCSVPGVKDVCCTLQKNFIECGGDETCEKAAPTKMKEELKKAKFDTDKLEDEAYLSEFCPVMSTFEKTGGKYCYESVECSFGNDEMTCTVPHVKPICCKVTKKLMGCDSDGKKCEKKVFAALHTQLETAGFDFSKTEDEDYQKKFCPVMSTFDDNAAKYCGPKAKKLFSVMTPGDGLTSAPVKTNMAFGVFCGVAFVTSFAVVLRRRWQATSVETHELLEVELEAEQGLVE